MKRAFLLLVAGLLLCTQPAFAAFGISSVSGNVSEVSPPPSAIKGAYVSTTQARVWFETIATYAGVTTDHNGTGSATPFAAPSDLTAGSLTGDFRTFMVHFDPGLGAPITRLTNASITFDRPILGVFLDPVTLFNSDKLSIYPNLAGSNADARGLELVGGANGDRFSISADRKTLHIDSLATSASYFDELRVATAVPEIATIGSWGLLGLGLAVAIRRKWLVR